MYNLFNLNTAASLPVLSTGNWRYVRDGLQQNLETVIRYYHRWPMSVKADHFIIRLLHSITTPKGLPIERYYDNVDGLFSLNLGMALGMTSPLSQGRLHDGVFYGPGTKEVLIATTEVFDPFDAEKNWMELTPIRVLRHPRSDLGLVPLNGKKNGIETGIAVIAINIPMLAIQWRSFWLREKMLAEQYGESPRGIGMFVHMFVLPNLMPSHLDYAIFNRFNNLLKGAPMGVSLTKNPFYLTDFSNKIDATQKTTLEQLTKQSKNFLTTLFNLGAVTRPNMQEVMEVPDLAPTRQVLWALALARIPMMDFLTRFGTDAGFAKNGQEVNRIRQAIRRYDNDQILRHALPTEYFIETRGELQDILDRLDD
jgi:hypothetical protein